MSESETPKQPESFLRKELAGHLWNDWYGQASDLKYVVNPEEFAKYGFGGKFTPEEKNKYRGIFLKTFVDVIKWRIGYSGGIPKVDVESLAETQKTKGIKYNELVDEANSLCEKILQEAQSLPLITEDEKHLRYEIPENHPVISLGVRLKEIMIEANELLYNQRCEFFD